MFNAPCQVYKRQLNTQEVLGCIEELDALGAQLINFSGGEVFLRPDYYDIMSHMRSFGMRLWMNTNGTLIDKSLANQLAKLGAETVSISVYGDDAEHHEMITRVPGSLVATRKAIENLSRVLKK